MNNIRIGIRNYKIKNLLDILFLGVSTENGE